MQEIIFGEHALSQMQERKISRIRVLETIRCADKICKQENDRKRAIKAYNIRDKKYLVVVIFEQEKDSKIVITVFITSKIKKYL